MLNNIGLPGLLLIAVVVLVLFGRGKICRSWARSARASPPSRGAQGRLRGIRRAEIGRGQGRDAGRPRRTRSKPPCSTSAGRAAGHRHRGVDRRRAEGPSGAVPQRRPFHGQGTRHGAGVSARHERRGGRSRAIQRRAEDLPRGDQPGRLRDGRSQGRRTVAARIEPKSATAPKQRNRQASAERPRPSARSEASAARAAADRKRREADEAAKKAEEPSSRWSRPARLTRSLQRRTAKHEPHPDDIEDSAAPLIEHLAELRTRLIRSVLAFIVGMVALLHRGRADPQLPDRADRATRCARGRTRRDADLHRAAGILLRR